jgi:hypothetical protein
VIKLVRVPEARKFECEANCYAPVVDRGEYLCPVCRQLSNSVLPLSPQLGECSAVVRSQPASLDSLAMEIISLLNEIKCAPVRVCYIFHSEDIVNTYEKIVI